jgi:hypothetical protein
LDEREFPTNFSAFSRSPFLSERFFAGTVWMIATACLILLGLACVWLAWIDLRDGIIPDWLNLLVAGSNRVMSAADESIIVTMHRSSKVGR